MNITFRPMTAKEAWGFLESRHRSFHSHLKHFGYKYDMFIPEHPAIREMYDQEDLTEEQLEKYRDIFINQIYDVKDLQRLDSVLEEEALPALRLVVDVLAPMAEKWKVQFPNSVEIETTYGIGGSYWAEMSTIIFRMCRSFGKWFLPESIPGLLQHEFIHLLIEIPIIQKYNVPQGLKERIVDIIGFEYFNIPIQKRFDDSFANKYITKEAIENDLPGAVQKMMLDYALIPDAVIPA